MAEKFLEGHLKRTTRLTAESRARLGSLCVPTLLLMLAGGCAHLPTMGFSPAFLPCRGTVPNRSTVMTWISPDAGRDRDYLDRWCATVGPVLVERVDRVDAAPSDRLAIVAWNIHVGAGDVAALVGRLRSGDFTAGRPVRHFVLLLQEAYRADPSLFPVVSADAPVPRRIVQSGRGPRRDIRTIARMLDLGIIYAPAMRNGRSAEAAEDRGNAILSTLPLEDLTLIELPFEKQRRVTVAATVSGRTEAGTWRLRVADVHVDAGLAVTRGGPFASRRRQARALISALSSSADPVVLGGDFNTWSGREPALSDLERAFPDARSRAATTWRGPLGLQGPLDHIFVRAPRAGGVETTRLPDRFGSDHHPLLAVITF